MVLNICSAALFSLLTPFCSESCIKGHRSSACHHTDRPLFGIKKKGRPVSQCPKCRELRQSKKLHSKCTCDHKDDAPLMQPLSSSSCSKRAFPCHPRLHLLTRFIARFIPIVPALPNGLKDVITASSSTALPPDSRQRGMVSHRPFFLKRLSLRKVI